MDAAAGLRSATRGIHAGQERHHRAVGCLQVPIAVDSQGGVGRVAIQHALHHLSGAAERIAGKRALWVVGRKPCGQQERVLLAQRHAQVLSQPQHHLPAGPGASCFQEAQVPGRDFGVQRQRHLAQPSALAPGAEQTANRGLGCECGCCIHALTLAGRLRLGHDV